MINLLPKLGKKRAKREYRLRMFSVVLLMLSLVALVLGLFSLPASVMLGYQKSNGEGDQSFLLALARQRRTAENELAITKFVVDHLAKESEVRSQSTIIEDLDNQGGEGINIRQFVFDEKGKLVISGEARSRSELSAFRDRLEGSKLFKKVELPLSDLAEETNPVFTITITLKTP